MKTEKEFLYPQKWVEPYLEGVILDITSKCNLCCTHCYVSNFTDGYMGADLTFAKWLEIFD